MEIEKHKDNTYANDIKGEPKHISQVESGKKGYYCQGCDKEMIAKKGDIRFHHFAHDPKDVTKTGKCTYSDETYRHILAKEILQRIKQIKVPALYKYPPAGIEGKPNKVRDSWFVSADTVKNELTFYEDENGTVSYGRNVNFESGSDKYHLITPDVTFFDENENPILLIEIVATHKADKAKIIKIRNLGIDTVQVTIPKDSPEEIENTFYKTSRTEWLYNYERENTTYIPVSKGDDEGVLLSDEFQRRLFEATESYECRAAQIKNLIRGFNKCLESEQFRKFKQHIGEEIQRVENNTEGHRIRLRELQDKHKRAIEKEFGVEEEAFRREEKEFREGEERFAAKVRDYEAKYEDFKNGIRKEEREYQPESQSEIDRIEAELERRGESSRTFGERNEEIRREENQLEQEYQYQERRIEQDKRTGAERIAAIGGRRNDLQSQYLKIEQGVRAEFDRKTNEFEQRASDFERDSVEGEGRIRDEYERFGRESVEAIENRDSKRISRVSGRLGDVLETREKLSNNKQGKITYKRLRKFKELFDSGTYKSWSKI